MDGCSRLAYTEAFDDEKGTTLIEFFHRAWIFFAAPGITWLNRVVTDDGANYRARDYTRCVKA